MVTGGERLEAAADELRAVAQFGQPVDTLSVASANLVAGLPDGAPWGDDGNGQQFAAKYVPARDNTLKAVSDTIASLRQYQADLRRMADDYEATEQKNAK